jgi:hypothetical protein
LTIKPRTPEGLFGALYSGSPHLNAKRGLEQAALPSKNARPRLSGEWTYSRKEGLITGILLVFL